MAAPYVFGEALLKIAVQEGGERAVDDLFRSPPTTEEHQLDPWTLVEDDEKSRDVPEPSLAKDEKEFDDGPFGAISWLLVLAERIPVKQALDAADGWGGDAYVAYERDGVSCVKVAYEGETSKDLDQMQVALTAWIEAAAGRTRKCPSRRVDAGPRVVRPRVEGARGGHRWLAGRDRSRPQSHLPVGGDGELRTGHVHRPLRRRPPRPRVHPRGDQRPDALPGNETAGAAGPRVVPRLSRGRWVPGPSLL